jgi:hypothetical protein
MRPQPSRGHDRITVDNNQSLPTLFEAIEPAFVSPTIPGSFSLAMHQPFKLTFNLTKSYQDEDGHTYVEGIASGTEVDLTGERMSVEALQSMVDSLKKGVIEFRSEHSHEWDCGGYLAYPRW